VARNKNNKRNFEKRPGRFHLLQEIKNWFFGVLMILLAVLVALSFFQKAGKAGELFMRGGRFLAGETVFIIPLILFLGGLVFFSSKSDLPLRDRKLFWPVSLAILILLAGATGMLGSYNHQARKGGMLGYFLSSPFLKYFGFWATQIIFLTPIIIGCLIFWYFLRRRIRAGADVSLEKEEGKKPSIIKRIFSPKFKVKEISPFPLQDLKTTEKQLSAPVKLETKTVGGVKSGYQPPPLDLLEGDKGTPTSGDTRINSAIIKKTLQNFGIDVAMSEINIGPTVTQYTFKPAEGIKLSKITSLSNDLALALASHPIRIEAPVPGRSLVGIEVPNKVRARVGIRELFEGLNFQKSSSSLLVALGRDVSGLPTYTDLARMPHMLVAGSTGSGKTIFLNALILSLLYQPSNSIKSAGPEFLRFILVDPKRVEFPVYDSLPHLLCPVIYNAAQTVNALRWLTGEMERRFDVLAEAKARDIRSFNEFAHKEEIDPLPFIVVIIDELADLMAAKGREIEAGIVRLAQMARAVGIHLVVATQRPSVEVITGLIKANITSRVTFQVASQVDSRTVLDTAGAEKLLGSGDMLFVSTDVSKPKRVQAAYISDKEMKKVIGHINSREKEAKAKTAMNDNLVQELERGIEEPESSVGGGTYEGNDPIFEEAKRVVIEARKASASLLQRRLRIGYARAARLIDILEDKGIVGPGEGAKPREVYGETSGGENTPGAPEDVDGGEEKWEKM